MKGVCSQGEEVAWSVLFLPTVLLPIDIFEGTFFGGDLFGSQALSNVFEFERVLLLRVVGGARVDLGDGLFGQYEQGLCVFT